MRGAPGFAARALLLLVAAMAMPLLPTVLPSAADLVLIVVAATALMRGPWAGAAMGLGGGWLIDLMPPGSTLLGASAVAYLGVGVLLGLARRHVLTSPTTLPVLPLTAVALASVLLLAGRGTIAAAGFGYFAIDQALWTWGLTMVAAVVLIGPLVALDRALAVRRWG